MRLTLGPLMFNWPAEKRRDFYARIADEAPVDSVCLGEIVCVKRAPFAEPVLADTIDRLVRAGKEVVLSTLALVSDTREMASVRGMTELPDLLVEANDVAALPLLSGRRHALGPSINIYNEATLAWFERRGAVRVCLPVELSGATVSTLAATGAAEIEVQAFGRLPLAISARCYHARAHALHKDGCQFVCAKDPDGMPVETLNGEGFLAVNGTQTLSFAYANLIGDTAWLRRIGVSRLRLSPHDIDMVQVARIFRDVLDGRREPASAHGRLRELTGDVAFANGFLHGNFGAAYEAAAEP